jgi:protein-disulfide isomerase
MNMMSIAGRSVRLAALAALLVAGACKGGGSSPADPKYDVVLPGADDVDDSLSAKIPGARMPATYGPDDGIKGAKAPLVTIVEFSDFQCPFCGQTAAVLEEVAAAYPDDVRLVFKHFPLKMHPDAAEGAKAAVAASRQDRFWAMHDRLFADRTAMKAEDLKTHAEALGLDADKFAADLADPAVAAKVEADQAQGRALGVQGTPTLFVNGVRIGGAPKPDVLRELVDAERQLADTLLAEGSKREEIYARILKKAGAGRGVASGR